MDTLDPIDALMLTGELVSSPMHVAALLIMTPPPGEDARTCVDRMHQESLTATEEIDPRLRRRPHRGVETGGMWVWRDVPDIDLSQHLERRTLPAGSGSAADLWELVSELHAERLDRSAPMWTAHLIDGLDDGRFAFYIKVHHIVIDGVAGLQMIGDSLSTDPDRREMPPFYAAKTTTEPADGDDGGSPGLPNPLSLLRSTVGTAVSGLNLTRHVLAGELSNLVGSLTTRSVAGPFGAPHTRFNTKLGPHRAVAATSLERARIGAVRQAAGVTGNDVVMAVISGVIRAWLAERDELPDQSLVAICPVL